MRALSIARALLAAWLTATCASGGAAIIAQHDSSPNGGTDSAPLLGIGFTTTDTFNNVSIQAKLTATGNGAIGIAYLTTRVGPGTTPSDELASVPLSFNFTPNVQDVQFTTLFSGLTLGPDTYYLLVFDQTDTLFVDVTWVRNSTANLIKTTAAGVTIEDDFFGTGALASYLPETSVTVTRTDPRYLFNVVGDLVNVVPEPAPLTLIGIALVGLAFTRHRKQ